MRVVESLALRVAPRTIPILTIGIMVFDLLMPVGVAVSVLYVLPLLLTFLSPRERDSIYFSTIATMLVWIGLFLKPSGNGLSNRLLGTLVLRWSGVRGLIHYKPLEEGLISAEAI